VADGDHIDAVLTGWAVNNDGAGQGRLHAPGLDGQAARGGALAGASASRDIA